MSGSGRRFAFIDINAVGTLAVVGKALRAHALERTNCIDAHPCRRVAFTSQPALVNINTLVASIKLKTRTAGAIIGSWYVGAGGVLRAWVAASCALVDIGTGGSITRETIQARAFVGTRTVEARGILVARVDGTRKTLVNITAFDSI